MSALASSWFTHLLLAILQTSATGAVVLLVAALLPRPMSRLRHAVLMVGLVKFAVPPMLPLPTGVFSALAPVPELALAGRIVATAGSGPLVRVLMVLHIAGFAIVIARLAAESRRLGAIRRSAQQLPAAFHRDSRVALLVSREVAVPVTFGILDPAIVIPRHLAERVGPAALRDIVAHEMEHVRRQHVLLNTFQAILGAIWWFDPVWFVLARAARAAREECCDDAVVARSPRGAAQYARTLLEAASCCTPEPAPLAAAQIADSRCGLLRRLERLAGPGFAPSLRIGLAGALLVALLGAAMIPGLRVSRDNRFAFDGATIRALRHHHSHNH